MNALDLKKESSKIKIIVLLILILLISLSIVLISVYGNEKASGEEDEFGQKYSTEENGNQRTDIIFETSEYIVIKKIRRFDRYFTQGLFMDSEDTLIESSGLYGQSTLQKYNVNMPDQKIFKIPIDRKYFAEGCCLYKNKIFQLTWRERAVYIFLIKFRIRLFYR